MILVTGAGGLLGSNLVVDLNRRGLAVIAAGRTCLPRLAGVEIVRCDLMAVENTDSLFAGSRPSCVIHCAALTDVDRCEADPQETWRVNVEMPRRLAASAAEAGSRFVYISSDSVFDGESAGYVEEDRVAPLNLYARSKVAGEIAVQRALPDALVIRTNIYGWNMQPKTSLAEWILSELEAGSEVPGFQDVVFCPMLVNDLGDIILEMLDRKLSGLYHVVGGDTCNKYEFALAIARMFGLNQALIRPATIETSLLRALRPKNTSLSTVKVCRAISRSMPSLYAGIERFKTLQHNGFVARLKQAGMEDSYARV